jgi:hypothetical protein
MGLLLGGTADAILYSLAAPITAYPFTIGVHFSPLSVAAGVASAFSLGNSTTITNSWGIQRSTAATQTKYGANTIQGVSESVGKWFFCCSRFISATNIRHSAMDEAGFSAFAQGITSTALPGAGLDQIGLGVEAAKSPQTQFWNGLIAEAWVTDTDIQPDGGQLSLSTLRQLFYGGPFSIPHVAANVIFYVAMDQNAPHTRLGDEFYTAKQLASLAGSAPTIQGSPKLGGHPPLLSPIFPGPPGTLRRVRCPM